MIVSVLVKPGSHAETGDLMITLHGQTAMFDLQKLYATGLFGG
ncbi:MAG: hypothetical protein U0894_15085 [Pirellulales bacterium]